MTPFKIIQHSRSIPIRSAQAVQAACQQIAGWWIGKRRGWTPDTRRYFDGPGYVVHHASRTYWWDGETLTPISEE
jgi:hypothetical protein